MFWSNEVESLTPLAEILTAQASLIEAVSACECASREQIEEAIRHGLDLSATINQQIKALANNTEDDRNASDR